MPIRIFAGDAVDLRYDPEAKAFRADPALDGPSFQVQALDYFAAQAVLTETDDTAKVRACLQRGLVAVDGDQEKAKAFLARPRARLVNPLFAAIWDETWGN